MSLVSDIYHRCLTGTGKGELTAQNVSLYKSSPYAIYCEKFISEEKKDPMSPYRKLLMERGIEHEKRVIETGYPECETVAYKEPEEGFWLLLDLMTQGVEAICGLPVFFLPENMQGRIDLLEKQPGHPSIFGDYHYVVKEIKLAQTVKQEYVMQGAFYNYLIAKVQTYRPATFFIINRDYDEIEYQYKDYEQSLAQAIEGTRAILEGREVPTPTYNACEWPWERFCNHQALRTRDVSLIGHVGPKKKANLVAHGFRKIWDIASATVEDLTEIPGIGAATAQKLILGARAIKQGEPILIDQAALQFPDRSTEIFLDLEGTDQPGHEDEIAQVDYLIGVLVRKVGNEEYIPFVGHRVQDEGGMFQAFVRFMQTQQDYVIYHWHTYERSHIEKLAERYNCTDAVKGLLLSHMIDLHKVATTTYVFPTYGNGLKDIAGFLKFKWRSEEINALDAIAYYLRYQQDPEGYQDKMQAIIDYNEDDCRATKVVKDWLHARSVDRKE